MSVNKICLLDRKLYGYLWDVVQKHYAHKFRKYEFSFVDFMNNKFGE